MMPATSAANVAATRDDGRAIAPHELGRPVAPRVLPRDDGQAGEVAAHVLGELIHRGIAPPRLLAERLEDDVVEIAGELPAQPIGIDGQPAIRLRGRRATREEARFR